MRRWHSERSLMLRRWKVERAKHRPSYGMFRNSQELEHCHCLNGPGTMRKHKPYECPIPRCFICHSEKLGRRLNPARANRKRKAIRFELEAAA